jgi:hypothetical protein
MTIDKKSIETKLRILAHYLWEQDGQPEGQLASYMPNASAMLNQEALIFAPIDEATAARDLLTNPPTGQD